MANLKTFKKAIDVLTVMNVAVTNIRLYPPTSAIIRNTVDRAYQLFLDILDTEEAAIFGESGNNFVLCGNVFDEAEQKKHPQAHAVLDILSKLGVKSVDFQKSLEKQELETFLKVISLTPPEIEAEGGLKKRIESEKLPHVKIDHKVYIVVDHDQRLVASIDLKDDDVVQYMTGQKRLGENDLQQIQQMTKDPEWVNKVFQAGMDHLLSQKQEKSAENLSGTVVRMMQTLDAVSDEMAKPALSRVLSQSIAAMDEEMIVMIMAQDVNALFDAQVIDHIAEELDDAKFERIAARLRKHRKENRTGESGMAEAEPPPVYDLLMNSDKGKRLQEKIQRQAASERSKREQQLAQLKGGLNRLMKEDDAVPLEDPAFIELLPEYLDQLFQAGKEKSADVLIQKLVEHLKNPNDIVRENVASVLAYTGRSLLAEKRLDMLLRIVPGWLQWLETETERTSIIERVALQVQELIRYLIKSERYGPTTPMVASFRRIADGERRADPEFEALIDEMLRHVASNDVLNQLVKVFDGKDEARQKEARALLMQMGGGAVEGLLDMLLTSHDMAERVLILRVVSEIGAASPMGIIRKIEAGGPWYFMRNLILMIGKIGSEDHLPHLIPFLKHDDFRVQRESLNTIYKIGGQYRGEVLLSALEGIDDRVKPNVVDMLGALAYEPAVDTFLQMLEKKQLFSEKISDKLKEKICEALGRIGSERAVMHLEALSGGKVAKGLKNIKSQPEAVKEAARNALARIRGTAPPETEKKADDGGDKKGVTISSDDIPESRNDDTVDESVVNMLMDGITTYAREKRFDEAEALRRKLIEMDAMAFSEIIRADEIIEKERREASASDVDQDSLGIWPELYDTLTPDEAGALYYAMEERVHEADETIFEQGERSNRLYFIHKGQLKLVFKAGERENLLKIVGSGDIVGEDTFFSISVTTTSMVTLSYTELSFLDKSVLEEWKASFPALESKLHDYCLRMERVKDILRDKGMDRRVHKRIAITGTVSVDLLNTAGARTGKNFKGNFQDISVGGLSFLIKSPNPRNASLLLGRKLSMDFDFPGILCPKLNMPTPPEPDQALSVNHVGTVIGVSHREADDYSVHVKFEHMLDKILAKQLKGRQQALQS